MVKSLLNLAGVLALATGAPAAALAQDMAGMKPPEGKEVTITGTVIDVSCKFGQGLSGAEHKMCSEVCADKGIPLAILGTDGKLYLATSPAMPGDGQNARLKPFAEQTVTVKGKAFNAGGAMAIQISSITKKA
jgi:type 1 fimbria pilin